MSWKYKFVDHTADAAVDVEADSLEELFIASAKAWHDLISDEKANNFAKSRKLHIEESSIEILLVSFLSELNFYYQNKKWRTDSIESLKIKIGTNLFALYCELLGTELKAAENSDKPEIKAITYHQMKLIKTKEKFSTRIVFDV